jgi:serine/threonine protein kinase
MGTVYRARDPRLDRDVALKVLRADLIGDHDRQVRLLQEAKAVSALKV